MKRLARFMTMLLLIVVVLAGFLFIIKNDIQTGLWLGKDLEPRSLGLWVLVAFMTGGMAGLLLGLGLWGKLRQRLELTQARKQLQQCRDETRNLQEQLEILDRKSRN
jgi:hypothetical protein